MSRHLRIQSYWSQLGIAILLLGLSFVLFGVLQIVVYKANGINPFDARPDLTNPHVLNVVKLIQGVSSIVVFMIPAFLAMVISFRGKYGYFLGFRKAQRMNMYVLAFMIVLLAFPFTFLLGELNQKIQLSDWMKDLEKDASVQMAAFLKVRSAWDIVVNLLVIALLPAIGEELCFRGMIQRIMIGITRNPWAGIIVTGFIFSALHLQFQGFLPRMFLGVILGALYWYSGSIWTSIIGHFVFNAVQVLWVSYAPQYAEKMPELPLLPAMISGIAVFSIMYFYVRQSTTRYAKVYETDELNEHNQFIA